MSANNAKSVFLAPEFFGDEKHMGMTLRDYFAAETLNGLLASPRTPREISWSDIANHAYMAADAMLAAREAK